MDFSVKKGNLFEEEADAYLCHCISSDFALGAGIAKEFAQRGVKKELFKRYTANDWSDGPDVLVTSLDGYLGCFNLVTKQNFWNKPTYGSLQKALDLLKDRIELLCKEKPIVLAMPKIGCGLDKLKWEKVEKMIKNTFADIENLSIHVWEL